MSHKFEVTHPWINFELDLRWLGIDGLLLLGEARSKCDHLAGVPLLPETADRLHRVYLAKGVHATTAIEGNTLTPAQIEEQLVGQLKLPPSKRYLQVETQNVIEAINETGQRGLDGSAGPIDVAQICEWNKKVLNNLALNDEVVPGKLRQHEVGVNRYKGAPHEDVPYLMARLAEWLKELQENLPDALSPVDRAVLVAIMAHLYLAWIHPFGDGNGRTARLMEFAILIRSGVPTPAAHVLSNFYNETRNEYYRQLQLASDTRSPQSFLLYALQGFVDGLKEQIEEVRKQTHAIVWESFVHKSFRGLRTVADLRRRELVLQMSADPRPKTAQELLGESRLAVAYIGKTRKTLVRDLNEVVELDLVEREVSSDGQTRFRARVDRTEAFMPQRVVTKAHEGTNSSRPSNKAQTAATTSAT